MCSLIAHRGPDGHGVHADGCAAFGHRRLAILDLSDAASQPMTTADQRYWITFNGEIYNFREIRDELETRGVAFRSHSDTEVLLEAYRAYGPACLQKLRGMFAFAVWDAVERELFLARDRAGKKPLFYRLDEHGLAFASEPKAFLADAGFEPRPDLAAIGRYLAYGYVPDPWSAFEGVRKLPPAHYALFKSGRLETSRYWRLRYTPKRAIREQDAADELLDLLRESVQLRMISDVPLGAFLSGGIDSSLVVALMAQLAGGRVKTFSIGFEESDFDELAFARQVAERYGTDHQEFIVRPEAASIVQTLVWHYGEPFADSSAIPTYYLSALTRRYVTVALSGDAGDENFAGYRRYLPHRRAEIYGRFPNGLRDVMRRIGRGLPVPASSASFAARALRWTDIMAGDQADRYTQSVMSLDSMLQRRLCTPDFLAASNMSEAPALIEDVLAESDAPDFVDAMMHADVETYLPGDILAKIDIATMAHGLEGRCPFVDHRLMEFAASLPGGLKLRDGSLKYLLRRVARSFLPDALIDRRKKGFSVPMARWLRTDLRPLAFDVLLGRTASQRGLLQPARVERLLRDHCDGRYEWHVQIWTLLMLELWFQEYIDAYVTTPSAYARAG